MADKVLAALLQSLGAQALLAYKTKIDVEAMITDAERRNKQLRSASLAKEIWNMKCRVRELNRVLDQYEQEIGNGGNE